MLTFVALVFAAMRPQLLHEWRLPEFERRDLLLVLDRSVSMRARDIAPTRFARAVTEIKQFLEEKPPEIDRVALVGFSNAAIAISHFTRNVDSLYFYLDWLAEDTRPNFGTDIGSALLTASDVIKRDGLPTTKVVLVISDGEDEGEVLESAINELRTAGVTIYSIGVGGSRPVDVPVPADDGNGDAGWTLNVTFNESTLRTIAAAGNGRYYRSQTGHELLDAMRDSRLPRTSPAGAGSIRPSIATSTLMRWAWPHWLLRTADHAMSTTAVLATLTPAEARARSPSSKPTSRRWSSGSRISSIDW